MAPRLQLHVQLFRNCFSWLSRRQIPTVRPLFSAGKPLFSLSSRVWPVARRPLRQGTWGSARRVITMKGDIRRRVRDHPVRRGKIGNTADGTRMAAVGLHRCPGDSTLGCAGRGERQLRRREPLPRRCLPAGLWQVPCPASYPLILRSLSS